MKTFKLANKTWALWAVLGIALMHQSFAKSGESSGGGDEYTLDFIKTATQVVYPWLMENGKTLSPAVDANAFLLATSPKDISSIDKVYESCDGSDTGREVEACYSGTSGKIYLSLSRYVVSAKPTPAKIGLVSHEIFRKMGIEGDGYEITKQMPIAQEKPAVQTIHIGGINSTDCLSAQQGVINIAGKISAPVRLSVSSCKPYQNKGSNEARQAFEVYATVNTSVPLQDRFNASFPYRVPSCHGSDTPNLVRILNKELNSVGIAMHLSSSCASKDQMGAFQSAGLPEPAGSTTQFFEQITVQTWAGVNSER